MKLIIPKIVIMYINQGNVFSSKLLCARMLSSLPKDVSPQISNAYDAVALHANATMLAVDFRLQGLGEDHTIGMHYPNLRAEASRLIKVV